ncbi:MAG: helix-turn-helix transcriptional regulator [Paenibacillaceae bacterium]|nr:helix-turn-helix transcriptional regulator [Paenibacillaceae bacterium]
MTSIRETWSSSPPHTYHSYDKINSETDADPELIQFEFMPSFINENFRNLRCDSGLFDFAYIEPFLVSENRMRPKLVLSEPVQQELEAILNEMLQESAHKKEGYKHLLKADLLRLLVIIGREYAKSSDENDKDVKLIRKHRVAMLNAIRYMDENYSSDLKLSDVCKYAMLSQTYFSGFIKYLTGKTFTEYINDLRIKKTIELLRETDKSVTDICFEVGFNEVTHFNRMFKKIKGLSPTAYRKRETSSKWL